MKQLIMKMVCERERTRQENPIEWKRHIKRWKNNAQLGLSVSREWT